MLVPHTKCFLCDPDPRLVVESFGSVFVMVGLGPITTTYAMIVSNAHCPSLADLAASNASSIRDIVTARRKLEDIRGPLLMTEHGRVPVCRDDDQHEAHCFHGHALLFAAEGRVLDRASSYYSDSESFTELAAALQYATRQEAYLLVSQSPSSSNILSGPLNAPRQLARTLVALSSEHAWAADWRHEPRKAEALAMATSLRAALREKP